MASLAVAQAELAGLVATLAQRHAEAVAALEKVTAPAFGLMGTLSKDDAAKPKKKPGPK
jgi:hypothetical protein